MSMPNVSPRPRALSPPHRATRPPATLAVFAPPRCLKHPPAAAAAVLLLANCCLPVSCHLIQLFLSLAYFDFYLRSFQTAAFLFSITSITFIFCIRLYTRTRTIASIPGILGKLGLLASSPRRRAPRLYQVFLLVPALSSPLAIQRAAA